MIDQELEYYTRWLGRIPPPNWRTLRCHGSSTEEKNLYTPVVFLDLSKGNQLPCVRAYLPFGQKKEFGGFAFTFADGTKVTIGQCTDAEEASDSIQFNPDEDEEIRGIYLYLDSNRKNTRPSKLHGVEVGYLKPFFSLWIFPTAPIVCHNIFND